jgi:hypothetical protein
MGVEATHPGYQAAITQWTRLRDVYDGEDAVKERGTLYLPKIDPKQTAPEYTAYLTRAVFYEAMARTVDGFAGSVLRKPPTVDLPPAMEFFLQDATGDGIGLPDFLRWACVEQLLMMRGGVLVDFNGERPYFAGYCAESIVNWGADFIILREQVPVQSADGFDVKMVDQLRELRMVDGAYTVTIWRKAEGVVEGATWVAAETIVPSFRGRPLDQIPFATMGALGRIEKPPLLGLANVSLSHYRSSADLEHGRHFTALPTLWISGADPNQEIRVGAASAIVLSDPSARVGFAEFSGQGLGAVERALEQKERQMAALGAALLTEARKGVEAAETVRLRAAGEQSLLMSAASSLEEMLRRALGFAGHWMGLTLPSESITLNRDFVDSTMSPDTLTALVRAYQAQAISLETFLHNLAQGEMMPPGVSIDDEAARVRAGATAPGQGPAQTPGR